MRIRLIVPLMIIVALPAATAAQSGGEDQVRNALQQATRAQAECRLDESDRFQFDHSTVVAPNGRVTTLAERQKTRSADCKPHEPAVLEDVVIRQYGASTAIAVGTITIRALPKARFTSVWVKDNGGWKEAAYQGTPLTGSQAPKEK